MNWAALGAVGELLGALAVVLTLAYLATQVRQNSKSMKVAAKQEMTRQFSDYLDMLLNDDKLLEIHTNGVNDGELTALDKQKFNMLMLKSFWYFASMHYQSETHSLDQEDWVQSKSMIEGYCRQPGVKKWWGSRRTEFGPNFVLFIEAHWEQLDT
jgi:hypothetical protein